MNWIKQNAALLTLAGVALLVVIVIKQQGGIKNLTKAVTGNGSTAQPNQSAATA